MLFRRLRKNRRHFALLIVALVALFGSLAAIGASYFHYRQERQALVDRYSGTLLAEVDRRMYGLLEEPQRINEYNALGYRAIQSEIESESLRGPKLSNVERARRLRDGLLSSFVAQLRRTDRPLTLLYFGSVDGGIVVAGRRPELSSIFLDVTVNETDPLGPGNYYEFEISEKAPITGDVPHEIERHIFSVERTGTEKFKKEEIDAIHGRRLPPRGIGSDNFTITIYRPGVITEEIAVKSLDRYLEQLNNSAGQKKAAYDVRLRPWYRAAIEGKIRSPIYPYFNGGGYGQSTLRIVKAGVGALDPTDGTLKGVLGCDLSLQRLSIQLDEVVRQIGLQDKGVQAEAMVIEQFDNRPVPPAERTSYYGVAASDPNFLAYSAFSSRRTLLEAKSDVLSAVGNAIRRRSDDGRVELPVGGLPQEVDTKNGRYQLRWSALTEDNGLRWFAGLAIKDRAPLRQWEMMVAAIGAFVASFAVALSGREFTIIGARIMELTRAIGKAKDQIEKEREEGFKKVELVQSEASAALAASARAVREANNQRERERKESLEKLEQVQTEASSRLVASERALKDTEVWSRHFADDLAHDVRGPIFNADLTALSMAPLVPPEARSALSRIRKLHTYTMQLADNILEVSEMARTHQQLPFEPVNLVQVLLDCEEMESELLQRNQLTLTTSISGIPPNILTHRGAFVRILTNLLHNAIRYIGVVADPEHPRRKLGEVLCRITRTSAQELQVEISDTGLGLSKETIELINSRMPSPDFQGLGHGLSISKRLAALLGGSLTAERRQVGGTSFFLRIPLIAAPDESPAPLTAPAGVVESSLRILLADDNEEMRTKLSPILSDDVVTASDGDLAVKLLRSSAPDIVVLDLSMPHLGGLEACRRMRLSGYRKPIIIYSRANSRSFRQEALDAEANDFLWLDNPEKMVRRIHEIYHEWCASGTITWIPGMRQALSELTTEERSALQSEIVEWLKLLRLGESSELRQALGHLHEAGRFKQIPALLLAEVALTEEELTRLQALTMEFMSPAAS